MKTILVTGGTGLVGSAINKIKNDYNFNFVFLDSKICDLLNYPETESTFKKHSPDYVIHLAACVGGLYKNMNQRVKMLEDNLLINTNVLKASYSAGVQNLVACLSTCVFPDKTTYPINETMLHDGPPHDSNEGYAYAKRILETQCKCYSSECGVNFNCIIPTNIYGPNDNFNLFDSHVIPGLIHKCYLAKRDSMPFVVKGSGNPLRQFIYSEDVARLIMKILLSGTNESFILSPSEEHSIKDVAMLISEVFDYDNIVFDSGFSDGQYRKTADNSKLIRQFGRFEFTELRSGIYETVMWFQNNYNSLRK
jgi:GDP-L-fucose synthase